MSERDERIEQILAEAQTKYWDVSRSVLRERRTYAEALELVQDRNVQFAEAHRAGAQAATNYVDHVLWGH